MEKKKITIEVEPATAVATVGLLRGIFPSIIEQLERQAATNGSPLKFEKVENMQEVLDEIYEKCIAETNLRKFAQAHLNSDGLPNLYRNIGICQLSLLQITNGTELYTCHVGR